MKGFIRKTAGEAARVMNDLYEPNADAIVDIVGIIVETFRKGHKALFFGNGGSAADAQHLAAEMVNRFRHNRVAFPAIALTTDSSILTSIGNDLGFDRIFSRQVEALGRVDDVVIALSTSGDSANILAGVAAARHLGAVTVGFAGRDGGRLAREVDYRILVPSDDTPRIQEGHILVGHIICELVERELAHPGDGS
jgi:D-sedoheptulose 7-phosphate isomerase